MINIQNIDENDCFKWYLIRYLNPANHDPARITKAEKNSAKKINFKDIKFPVRIRDIYKIEKKRNSTRISVFGYENKKEYSIYLEKERCEEKHVDLLLIGEYRFWFIYTGFESILVLEDNGKQNPNEFYTNKYQKHVACSYGYTLVCAYDKFSKLLNHTKAKMLFY